MDYEQESARTLDKLDGILIEMKRIGEVASKGQTPKRSEILELVRGCAAVIEMMTTFQVMMVNLMDAMDEEGR